MVDIPSFFNRIDFISILLPGYVAVVSYLILFQPAIFSSQTQPIVDIANTVTFLVAGPALGLTLQRFHYSLLSIVNRIRTGIPQGNSDLKKFLVEYIVVRLKYSKEEKGEVQEITANYDFCISTALTLWAFFFLSLYKFGFNQFESYFLLAGGIILLYGGYSIYHEEYVPLIQTLYEKYTSKPPEFDY